MCDKQLQIDYAYWRFQLMYECERWAEITFNLGIAQLSNNLTVFQAMQSSQIVCGQQIDIITRRLLAIRMP